MLSGTCGRVTLIENCPAWLSLPVQYRGWLQEGRVKLALPVLLGHAAALGSSLVLALLFSQPRESSPEPSR